MMTYTHRGIGPSATEDLVRKFARSERQTPRSAPRGIVQGRNMTQVGSAGLRHDCDLWRLSRVRSTFGGATEFQEGIIGRSLGRRSHRRTYEGTALTR